jgi:hypothetical protein
MPRDQYTLDHLASEMAKCARRNPEFRKPVTDAPEWKPFRLVGVVDGHAVVRRRGAQLMLVELRIFDTWPLCDKDGIALHAD